MRPLNVFAGFIVTLSGLSISSALASMTTIGPNGINSAGLMLGGMPLDGDSIAIGQVELNRPGKRVADGGFDSMANSNSTINPADVFVRTVGGAAIANMNINDHAEQVAGVMISTDVIDPDGAGPMVAPTGVATGADLYSSAFNPMAPDFDGQAAISAQHIALQNGGDVRAINMSFVNPRTGANTNNGDQQLSLFVDWSARVHDVLYVVGMKNTTAAAGNSIPTDNFNGMTIGRSQLVGSVYRQVSAGNDFAEDADGDRTSIALIAPGDAVDVTGLNNVAATVNGSSFAAPHVTGTVALLQQFADDRIMNVGAPRWNSNGHARRHEVMKAVLMNSVDKLIDDGTVMVNGNPVPMSGLLGMERTVLDTNGDDWTLSEAFNDGIGEGGDFIPLDDQMGTGHEWHLNFRKVFTSFAFGSSREVRGGACIF